MKKGVVILIIGLILAELLRFLGVPSFGDVLSLTLGEPTLLKRIFVLILLGVTLFLFFRKYK